MGLLEIILHGRENAQVDKAIVDRCNLADLTDTDHAEYRCAIAAIDDFSKKHPKLTTAIISPTNPSRFYYPLTDVDPAWDSQTHQVKRILTNLDMSTVSTADEVHEDEWDFRITFDYISGSDIIRFVRNIPRERFGVLFTRPHSITIPSTYPTDPITTTISPSDEETVGYLMASKILDRAASKSAEFMNHGSMGSDGVDLSVVMDHYTTRSKYYMDAYLARIAGRSPTAGPVWVSTPLESPLGIRPIHPTNVYG